ncbi:hypothetical protein ACWFQ8_18395 [Streptomyces sp. NPDC055254]
MIAVALVHPDPARCGAHRYTSKCLYPDDTEDQAVLRPLTRARTKAPYERARLAAGALRIPRVC